MLEDEVRVVELKSVVVVPLVMLLADARSDEEKEEVKVLLPPPLYPETEKVRGALVAEVVELELVLLGAATATTAPATLSGLDTVPVTWLNSVHTLPL